MSKQNYSLIRLALAVLIALLALYAYSWKHVQAEDLALGKENFHAVETWNGLPFTGSSVSEIAIAVNQHASMLSMPGSDFRKHVVWLGNSQLHYINQFKKGDHLAPYWYRHAASCPDCLVPLGLSLPNANFQEHFAISHYVRRHLPISALVLEAVFDDLREDGLRAEFSEILSAGLRSELGLFPVGRDILALSDSQFSMAAAGQDDSGLDGAVQKKVEKALNEALGNAWSLWNDRPSLRAGFLTDLYLLRNWVLNIKSTTARKIIKPRYERNMLALEAILLGFREEGIPVLMYVAPIRQDHPIPYDMAQYNQWKREVEQMAARYSAIFVNLEKLVPNDMWGTYSKDDIDFMHFQGGGHKLVAEALFPIVQSVMK